MGGGKEDKHYALFTKEHLNKFFNDLKFNNICINLKKLSLRYGSVSKLRNKVYEDI